MTSPVKQYTSRPLWKNTMPWFLACLGRMRYRAVIPYQPTSELVRVRLKILNAVPDSLTVLGSLNAPVSEVVRQSTKFIASCYSRIARNDMSEIRYKVWAAKFGNTVSSASSIQKLPPTSEAFTENVKRAHLQTCIWKAAVLLDHLIWTHSSMVISSMNH